VSGAAARHVIHATFEVTGEWQLNLDLGAGQRANLTLPVYAASPWVWSAESDFPIAEFMRAGAPTQLRVQIAGLDNETAAPDAVEDARLRVRLYADDRTTLVDEREVKLSASAAVPGGYVGDYEASAPGPVVMAFASAALGLDFEARPSINLRAIDATEAAEYGLDVGATDPVPGQGVVAVVAAAAIVARVVARRPDLSAAK